MFCIMLKAYFKTIALVLLLLPLAQSGKSNDGTGHLHLQAPTGLKQLMLNSYVSETIYRVPTDPHLMVAETLFDKLLIERNYSSSDVLSWTSIGFKLEEAVDETDQRYAVISESAIPTQGSGHGFYAIKLHPIRSDDLSKFLQAPHRPSDLYTHEIVYDMLTSEENIFSAAAWATTHRNNVDLCKETKSYFNVFSKSIARIIPNPTILQLHGFAKESHGVDVDVIFSSTKKESTPEEFHPIANCLKSELEKNEWKLRLFPEEIDFLGGTLNINAEIFYQNNEKGKFIHFETSAELRTELRGNDDLKRRIVKCIAST